MSEGPRETKAPELKPYRTQKTMMGALEADGSQRARTMMEEKRVVMIMTLNLPMRSAIIPGTTRPNILDSVRFNHDEIWMECTYEAALRMGMRYIDKPADMPCLSALDIVSEWYIRDIERDLLKNYIVERQESAEKKEERSNA